MPKKNPDLFKPVYSTYDYKAVYQFSPLSEDNWLSVSRITNAEVGSDHYSLLLDVEAKPVNGQGQTAAKKMKIEVTSFENDSIRVRFNKYAEDFKDYRDNIYGPITKNQLDWIKKKEAKTDFIDISDWEKKIVMNLNQVQVIIQANPFWLQVKRKSDGLILHEDGWCMKPESENKTKGLLFVDENYGGAVAALKSRPAEAHYYGCGESYNYQKKDDYMTSSTEHTGQMVTCFDYDDYGYEQGELDNFRSHPVDYYFPMYFGGPFAIEQTKDYAYAVFMDNPSQTYFNFSDPSLPSNEKDEPGLNFENCFFFGAQHGELDYHLVFSDFSETGKGYLASVLERFSLLHGKDHVKEEALNLRGVMPPAYIFGYFQGVYGLDGVKRTDGTSPSPINEPNHESSLYVEELTANYKEAGFPLEGLAIDIDIQDDFKVFTTRAPFWTGGQVGVGQSVFEFAHEQDLVCHTNITCFIRDDDPSYEVFETIKDGAHYTKRDIIEKGEIRPFTEEELPYGGDEPEDAYSGFLWYGSYKESAPAVFPDFGDPATQKWWGANYWGNKLPYPLLQIGLDFVWQDMTVPAMAPHVLGNPLKAEPNTDQYRDHLSDNTFNWKSYHPQTLLTDPRFTKKGQPLPFTALRNMHAYMECKATYEKGLLKNPNIKEMKYQRSYIISRGGYVGLQHFGGMWLGDNTSDWKHLETVIPMTLNMSLCGVAVNGADIGGFGMGTNGNNADDPVLMMRWVQTGCLLPWFRNHYARQNSNRGIDGKYYQELYAYTETIPGTGKMYSDVLSEFVKLRVRWNHLLYDAMYEFVQCGLPLVKPTCLYEGGGGVKDADMTGYQTKQNDQFFIGRYDIAVAPTVQGDMYITGGDRRGEVINHPVWLPNNRKWFVYDPASDCAADQAFNATPGYFGYIEGNRIPYSFNVPIDKLPIFIRDGAIIPTHMTADGAVKNIQQLDENDPFVLDLWPGAANTYRLYMDDGGKTRKAETKDDYAVYEIKNESGRSKWEIAFARQKGKREIGHPFYLRLRASNEPDQIEDSLDRDFASVASLEHLFNGEEMGYYYDGDKKELWIRFDCPADQKKALDIIVHYEGPACDIEQLFI